MTDSPWVDSIVLSKMNRYFWGGRGRREGMEKGGMGGRMDGWEKLITEEGTRAWVLGGGQLCHDEEFAPHPEGSGRLLNRRNVVDQLVF